jgi:hypothetical protein
MLQIAGGILIAIAVVAAIGIALTMLLLWFNHYLSPEAQAQRDRAELARQARMKLSFARRHRLHTLAIVLAGVAGFGMVVFGLSVLLAR